MDMTMVVLCLAAFITGVSKFSVGGMGLVILPVMMLALPGPEALGVILPMYLLTDLSAVLSYRRDVSKAVLARFLPLLIAGVMLGGWLLGQVDASQFATLLGLTILAMLILGIYLDKAQKSLAGNRTVGGVIGFLGGAISATTNGAGPLISLYLMDQKLSKESYVSTRAWLFLIVNAAKIPFYLSLGLISSESLVLSSYSLPALLFGMVCGYLLLNKINLTHFKWLVRITAGAAAAKLLMF